MQIICFHNPDEENGYLSNWYAAGFTYKEVYFTSMEQYIVTAKLFCHRNCSPKLSKNIKKLLPIMPSITAHMSYLFWSPKEKRLVHPTRDVNWRRFQEDFEEILEA